MPSEAIHWLALLGAAAVSTLFLMRNLAPLVVAHLRQHASLALGAIGYVTHSFVCNATPPK